MSWGGRWKSRLKDIMYLVCVYTFSWLTSQASDSVPALYKKVRHVIMNDEDRTGTGK